MPLVRVLGQPFALVDHADGWRGRVCARGPPSPATILGVVLTWLSKKGTCMRMRPLQLLIPLTLGLVIALASEARAQACLTTAVDATPPVNITPSSCADVASSPSGFVLQVGENESTPALQTARARGVCNAAVPLQRNSCALDPTPDAIRRLALQPQSHWRFPRLSVPQPANVMRPEGL